MNKDRKEIIVGEKKFYVRRSTVQEGLLANIEYSKTYAQCLRDKLPLTIEIEKMLKERGVLVELDQQYAKAAARFQELVLALQTEKDESKRQELTNEFHLVRAQQIDIDTQKNLYNACTVEGQSEEIRLSYLVWSVTEHEDGSRVWSTFQDFKNENNQEFVLSITRAFFFLMKNIPEESLNYVPTLLAFEPDVEEKTEEAEEKLTTASPSEIPVV